jgi:membrane fusion protein (multidrug efflux system)
MFAGDRNFGEGQGGAQAQKLEAEARASSVRAQRVEAEARLAASMATYNRLRSASATPGVVSGNELENAQRLVEAEPTRVQAYKDNENVALAQVKVIAENETAARAASRSAQSTENYLRIVAPFDGLITERNAHNESLAGPSSSAPVGVRPGIKVNFTVPAFPGETFTGAIARISP